MTKPDTKAVTRTIYIDACDLIYHHTKKDHPKVPTAIIEVADLVNEYLTTETPVTTEIKLVDALIRIGSTDEKN